MIDDGPFVETSIGEVGDRDHEDAVASADRIHVRRN
jgi:hypothetical protein